MMRHNPSQQHLSKLASARLKPFDWANERDIRQEDVPVFKAAASAYDHVIIVRATNEYSIQYIGRAGFTPKPIDCKPKTASHNAFTDSHQVPCAGLVVDPTFLPNAFTSKKLVKAIESWDKFTRGHTESEKERKVFRRYESAGFYSVDTYKSSKFYGCLMLSDVSPPDKDFRLSVTGYQKYRQNLNMRYIYGDYDLYGLINVAEVLKVYGGSAGRLLAEKSILKDTIHGVTNFHSPTFKSICEFLNNGIGAPMVQHGSQDTFGHSDEKLYVFTPVGGAYVINDSEAAIRDVYQLVFKEEPIQRSF